jgi:hypothetical protein
MLLLSLGPHFHKNLLRKQELELNVSSILLDVFLKILVIVQLFSHLEVLIFMNRVKVCSVSNLT